MARKIATHVDTETVEKIRFTGAFGQLLRRRRAALGTYVWRDRMRVSIARRQCGKIGFDMRLFRQQFV